MKVEIDLSVVPVKVVDDASSCRKKRTMLVDLDGSYGPRIRDVSTESEVGMDWFDRKLAAMVYSSDADEPAVCVEFDTKGRVKRVAVRADLREKIETL